jgi:hypothetical protein
VLAQGPGQQLLKAADHVVKVQRAGLDHLTAGEGQQLAGQSGGAFGSKLDLLYVVADGLQVNPRRFPGRILADKRGIVQDDGQQVVEVMRDPPGQLTQAFQPLQLLVLALEPVLLSLRLQPLTVR